jgi:hypothetical protein
MSQKNVSARAKAILDAVRTIKSDGIAAIQKASGDRNLSEVGRRAQNRKEVLARHGELFRFERELTKLQRQNRSAAPKLPPLAKDDIAGALRDIEARGIVRAMGKIDDLSALPIELAAAVVRAPAAFSGVSPKAHEWLTARLVQQAFPNMVDGLNSDLEAVASALSAVQQTKAQLQSAAGVLDDQSFNSTLEQSLAPIQAELDQVEKVDEARSRKENTAASVEDIIQASQALPREAIDQMVDRLRKISDRQQREDIELLKAL